MFPTSTVSMQTKSCVASAHKNLKRIKKSTTGCKQYFFSFHKHALAHKYVEIAQAKQQEFNGLRIIPRV